MREDVRTKGLRYLAEGRLTIRDVGPGDIRATCKGDGAVHQVGPGGQWPQIRDLQAAACPACGGTIFRPMALQQR